MLENLPIELRDSSEVTQWINFEVKSEIDAQIAAERLQEINSRKKMMDKFRDEFIRPQKRILADFEAKCRAALDPFTRVESVLRAKLGAYMDSVREQKRQEAEAQRLRQLEEAKIKQRQMEDKILFEGVTDVPVELQKAHVKALETFDVKDTRQTVRASSGRVAESLYWVWEVEDLALVPQQFFVLDEKQLNEIAKKYSKEIANIPGIKFTQKARVVVQ